jgi:hypothetical protein
MWWNSRQPVSTHRPSVPTNVQRPASRCQTDRFTAAGMCRVVPVCRPAGPRSNSGGELRPLELIDQDGQRTVNDCGWIAARQRVPHQVARALQLRDPH